MSSVNFQGLSDVFYKQYRALGSPFKLEGLREVIDRASRVSLEAVGNDRDREEEKEEGVVSRFGEIELAQSKIKLLCLDQFILLEPGDTLDLHGQNADKIREIVRDSGLLSDQGDSRVGLSESPLFLAAKVLKRFCPDPAARR